MADPNGCSSLARNSSALIRFPNPYEGVPETLTLNAVAWLALVALFAVMRRSAFNYGRLALVHGDASWTRLFYGGDEAATTPDADADERRDSLAFADGAGGEAARCYGCGWVSAVLAMSRDRVRLRCGPDAVHYLSFQRHLIALLAAIALTSLCVALPINFAGELEGDAKTFGHTTIANLDPASPWLWAHALLAFAYLPLAVIVMRRSTGRKPLPDYATRTLLLTHVAKRDRDAAAIEQHVRRRYRDVDVLDVQLAYDTHSLERLERRSERASSARRSAEERVKRGRKPLTVRDGVSPCAARVDAVEYYRGEERRYRGEIELARPVALAAPLPLAFVTLASPYQVEAALVLERACPPSRRRFEVEQAPAPSDVIWENLHVEPGVWYLKAFALNVALFVALFFLTTPAIVVNALDAFYASSEGAVALGPLVSEFVPTLLLWTTSATLPAIVSSSDRLLSHWTRSKLAYSVMVKTFSFLLLMTLILPSLGLTSLQAFLEATLQRDGGAYRWECVFLPDRGAFFVNYVITSALIGTALELIRFPELCLFALHLARAKSSAERAYAQRAVLTEFPFGVHYAWTLAVFTITVVYSLACPLITPFGLLYLLLKHFVDKHNLCFAYRASDMSGIDGGRLHATAVRAVRVSVVLLNACMAALAGVRGGVDARTIASIVFALVSLGALLVLGPFPSCEPPPPLSAVPVNSKYVAPVLLKPSHGTAPSPLHDYGSGGTSETNRDAADSVVDI